MMSGKTRFTSGSSEAYEEDAYGQEDEESLLVFTVGEVALGVFGRQVDSVSGTRTPAPVPGAPPHVLGLVAHGDRVVPLIDLGLFLELGASGEREADALFHRILFVSVGELEAGLVCHRANGLAPLRPTALDEPTVLQGPRLKPFLIAELETRSGLIGLLDLRGLLEAAAVS